MGKQISFFGWRLSAGRLFMALIALACAAATLACGDDGGASLAIAIGAGAVAGGGQTQVSGEAISTAIPNNPANPSALLLDHVDKTLRQYYRNINPLNTIVRGLRKRSVNSWVYKFWKMDERPLSCYTQAAYVNNAQRTETTALLTVDNASSFIRDNVLMVPSMPGYSDLPGGDVRGTLKLEVLAVAVGTNQLKVQVVNGQKAGAIFPVPDIPAGTQLVRVGTSLVESAGRTDPYGDLPEDEFNYVQRFGTTVAVTPFFEEHAKEIDFGLDVQLRRRTREFLEEIEASLLFGSRCIRKSIDRNAQKYYMGGFEFYVDNTAYYNSTVERFTREEYSSIMEQLFAANAGSTKRILFCGSGLVSRFNNSTEVIRNTTDLRPSVIEGIEVMGLRGLGSEVDIVRHPLFDAYGMTGSGLFVDPANVAIASWGGLQKKKLDPSITGESNEEKHFIHEALTLEIAYKDTHMWLKGAA